MQRVHIDAIEVDDFERHFLDGQPFTGEVIETDAEGTVVERSSISDGWEDGPQRAWYPNGQLRFEGTSRMKSPVGRAREWHENGRLAQEQEFDDTGHLLVVRRWDENGALVSEHHQSGRS